MIEIRVPARLNQLEPVLKSIGEAMCSAGMDERLQNNVALAAEEVFVNIASYAYPSGNGEVTLRIVAGPNALSLEFQDGGRPYNPLNREDPDTALPAEKREIGGLGVFLVKKLMDRVEYRYEDGKNILRLEKSYPGGQRAGDGP